MDGNSHMRAQSVEVLTVDIALANAARLLRNAELDTNHATMERLERLADTWISVANLLRDRERV